MLSLPTSDARAPFLSAPRPATQRLHKSIVVWAIVGVFMVGTIVAAVSISSLYLQLREQQEAELIGTLRTHSLAVDEYVSRIKDVALQITSRTKAREKLEAYNKGAVTHDEFVRFSAPILSDALNLAPQISGISRLDSQGQLAIALGVPIPEEHWPSPAEEWAKPQVHGPIQVTDTTYFVVRAPIVNRQSNQGWYRCGAF